MATVAAVHADALRYHDEELPNRKVDAWENVRGQRVVLRGESAGAVTVPFSNYKTGTFTYDPEQQLYLVEEYGEPYIDGDTGEQVGVTNLVVIQTACRNTGDSLGHITVDLSGSGEGYFACGGKIVPITWSKQAPDGQLYYYGPDGAPLTFGTGRTYVCIIPLDREVTWAP